MNVEVPRLRMFAGPNGSGKTTVKVALQKPEAWFGIYINPDDLETHVQREGFLELGFFGLSATNEEVQNHFRSSTLLEKLNLQGDAGAIECQHDRIDFSRIQFNSYHASVLSDFLRRQAIAAGRSFTFETVMSAPDKVELLRAAQKKGFRTYLYYIATEDPAINVQRVKNRVADGGHDVPEEKIVARYHRSLSLLPEAIRYANRAFLFDTSEAESWYFAEITDGFTCELKSHELPNWFQPIWEQFPASE